MYHLNYVDIKKKIQLAGVRQTLTLHKFDMSSKKLKIQIQSKIHKEK